MRTDIMMVTHAKDYDFAWYALRSVKKFASGFGDVLVVVPTRDVAKFTPLVTQLGFRIGGFVEVPGKGMLHHEVKIMEADRWCPMADAILHLDSDCVFVRPVTPSTYFFGGRPVLYRERFEDFRHYAARYSWKECVRRATGIDPEWETMVRHPAVHLSATYPLARHLISKHTGMGCDEYIMSCRNEFPQTFAEFPVLGAVAIEHAPDLYHFVDHSCGGKDYVYSEPRDCLKAFWTHGGIAPVRAELEAIIA